MNRKALDHRHEVYRDASRKQEGLLGERSASACAFQPHEERSNTSCVSSSINWVSRPHTGLSAFSICSRVKSGTQSLRTERTLDRLPSAIRERCDQSTLMKSIPDCAHCQPIIATKFRPYARYRASQFRLVLRARRDVALPKRRRRLLPRPAHDLPARSRRGTQD